MSEASVHSQTGGSPQRLRRHYRTGLANLYRFLCGTGGLESAFERMFALAGPTEIRRAGVAMSPKESAF